MRFTKQSLRLTAVVFSIFQALLFSPHANALATPAPGISYLDQDLSDSCSISHDGSLLAWGKSNRHYIADGIQIHSFDTGYGRPVLSGDGNWKSLNDPSNNVRIVLPTFGSETQPHVTLTGYITAFSYDGLRLAGRDPSINPALAPSGIPVVYTLSDHTASAGINKINLSTATGVPAYSGATDIIWNPPVLSADGNTVATNVAARFSPVSVQHDTIRWNDNGSSWTAYTMPLPSTQLSGFDTIPLEIGGISANGTTIVGHADDPSHTAHAIRWQGSATDRSLPGTYTQLDAGLGYSGSAATGVSADGKIIVGAFEAAEDAVHPFYYTDARGMRPLESVLQELGVTVTPDYLIAAFTISGDGNTIVGYTADSKLFLAKVPASGGSKAGVITVDDLARSVDTMRVAPMAASGITRQTTSTLTSALQQTAPRAPSGIGGGASGGAGGSGGAGSTDGTSGLSSGNDAVGHLRAWMVGTAVSDRDFAGDDQGAQGGAGLSWVFPGGISVGGGVFYGKRTLQGDYDSRQIVDDTGLGLFVNYAPEEYGLRLSGGLVYQLLDLDLKRGYPNGSATAASTATTEGTGITAMAQAGWVFPIVDRITAQPFVSYSWSAMHINGYDESGGPFDASFGSVNETINKTRNGVELTYALNEALSFWTWGAWNHRFESHGMAMSGSAPGLGSFNLGRDKVDQDWFDTGVGVRWQATQDMSTFLKVGSAFDNRNSGEPDLSISLGFTWDM